MKDIRLPWWALDNFQLVGAEDPPAGSGADDGNQGGSGDGADGNNTDGDDGDDGDDGSPDPQDTDGLKAALRAERRRAKTAEREAKQLRDAEEARANANKTEVERAKDEAEKAKAKAARLAEGYLTVNVNQAIIAAATKANFHDPEDAIAQLDRSVLTIEQDAEDPSKVTIDKKGVETAVKALATRKPHLVKTGTQDGQPSGGQFGGTGGGTKKEADEAALRAKYSAL